MGQKNLKYTENSLALESPQGFEVHGNANFLSN